MTLIGWVARRFATRLNKVSFSEFLAGNIPAICIPNFLSQDRIDILLKEANDFGFEPYDSAEDDISRIGLPLVDCPDLIDYLNKGDCLRQEGMYVSAGKSILEELAGFLSLSTSHKVQILEHNGRKFCAGVFRSFNSTIGGGIHLDRIQFDCPDLKSLEVEFQGSLVLHLTGGGPTVCYNREHQDTDDLDPLFVESGWKYSNEVVKGASFVSVPSEAGHLSIIRTDTYHKVEPVNSTSPFRRISFSVFFVIMKGDSTIYLYS